MKTLFSFSLLALLLCGGCVSGLENYKSTKTSLELQAFQKKDFETNKKIAFAATLSVFQDLGYMISSAELGTGFITAKSPTKHSFGFGYNKMVDTKATAFIEELKPGTTSIRLNFISSLEISGSYGSKAENDIPVEEQSVYVNAFNKIQEGIFIRKETQ